VPGRGIKNKNPILLVSLSYNRESTEAGTALGYSSRKMGFQ
jgi:hypothetical protein